MSALSARFRKLHEGKQILILPNAWDVGSAVLFEKLGASAIATTSAGVSWAHGTPDGNRLDPKKLALLATRIAKAISVPLSVDFEGGYSEDPSQVAAYIRPVLDAGVTGINIEDGTSPFDLLLSKISKIRIAAEKLGIDLFINARTDVYLQSLVPASQQVAETIRRGKALQEAGADGLFVPGLANEAAIREITASVRLPVNLLAVPGLPNANELSELGVKRLSAGSAIAQSIWKNAADLAEGFLKTGDANRIISENIDYSFMQDLLNRH